MKKLPVIFIFFLLTTFSCQKGKLVGEHYVHESSRELIPYLGFEQLTFKGNDTVEHFFSGEDRIYSVNKTYVSVSSDDYILSDQDYIRFTGEQNQLSVFVSPHPIHDNDDVLDIYFIYLEGDYTFYTKIYLPNGELLAENYYDSLLVNQHQYYHVYYDTMTFMHYQPFPDHLPQFPVKSYYSTTFGVLKIDFSDGSTWELEHILWAN